LSRRAAERLERLGHVALDGLDPERTGELVGQALKPFSKMPSRNQIDVEIGQSGCHRSAPPTSAVRVLAEY
jgi:hypothetical protein